MKENLSSSFNYKVVTNALVPAPNNGALKFKCVNAYRNTSKTVKCYTKIIISII